MPLHLLRALGNYHSEADLWRFVTQLELYGVEVAVRRVQLGNPQAEGFGRQTTIYHTGKPLPPEGWQNMEAKTNAE